MEISGNYRGLYFFSFTLCQTTKRGTALKGEEYVPEMVPINKAKTNHLIVVPPKRKRASNIKIIVRELFNDLDIVSVTALLAKSSKSALG